MKRFILFLFILIAVSAYSQDTIPRTLHSSVGDSFTGLAIAGVKVEVFDLDSVLVDSVRTEFNGSYGVVVKHPGSYIVRYSHDKYQTAYHNVKVRFYREHFNVHLPDVFMLKALKQRNYELGEATVTTSRIKFYHKGDTLVFDADAFNTAEGSMLDGLMKKLPGVELKRDGRIFVNGRYVDQLLLNGTEFFKGNNRLMLDNLPAYMVKHVQTYEKKRFGGASSLKPDYVMDIKLKKQYETSWLANAEAGGGITRDGSDGRYLGRLFAMRFSKFSRLALFGNVNNLNENLSPGATGDWSPATMLRSQLTTRSAGLDYLKADNHYKWSVRGDLTVQNEVQDDESKTNRVNFLPEGDTYDWMGENARNKSFKVQTNHEISLRLNGSRNNQHQIRLKPFFSFTHHHNRSNSVSGTFFTEPTLLSSSAILDSLRRPLMGQEMRQLLINRTNTELLTKGDFFKGGIAYDAFIETRDSKSFYLIEGSADYQNISNKSYDHYLLEVMGDNSSYRNRYMPEKMHKLSADVNLMTTYVVRAYRPGEAVSKLFHIYPGVSFAVKQDYSNRLLYRLDRLDEGNFSLGTLPSMSTLLDVLDSGNSYDSNLLSYNASPNVSTRLDWLNFGKKDNQAIRIDAKFQTKIQHENLDYCRVTNFKPKRTSVDFSTDITINYNFLRKSKKYGASSADSPMLKFQYKLDHILPDMLTMLNITDDANPLLVTKGNESLHRAVTHTMLLGLYKDTDFSNFKAVISYVPTNRALTMSSVYDKQTGVRTLTPQNIDGNWHADAEVYYMMSPQKSKKWTFETRTQSVYHNSEDLISLSESQQNLRSIVKTLSLIEALKGTYRFSEKYEIGFRVRGSYLNARSARTDFAEINAGDFDFSLSAQVELPGKIKVNTDLTQYCRRGYQDASMNSNELVWNFGLSRSFLSGNLTLRLDGFDILGQLSNVQRTVNVQGRTERFYSSMPSYFMARLSYRLNKKPKNQTNQ